MTHIVCGTRVRLAACAHALYRGHVGRTVARTQATGRWIVVLDMELGFGRKGVYWAKDEELEMLVDECEGETRMNLEIGKIYKSLAGCPVKLLDLYYDGLDALRLMAKVEYVDEVNNYGYGKGATGLFYGGDLTEWDAPINPEWAIAPAQQADATPDAAHAEMHQRLNEALGRIGDVMASETGDMPMGEFVSIIETLTEAVAMMSADAARLKRQLDVAMAALTGIATQEYDAIVRPVWTAQQALEDIRKLEDETKA